MPAATLVAGAGLWPSLGGLDRSGPCGRVKPIKRGFLRAESDVRIVLQHPPRKVRNCLDDVLGPVRDDRVPSARYETPPACPALGSMICWCSKLCSDRVDKRQIGTGRDRIASWRFSAGNRKIRRDSREGDGALIGLANRWLLRDEPVAERARASPCPML